MKVSELGEFELIQLMADTLGPPVLAPPNQYGLLTAIGDDTAIWRTPESVEVLTTDTMIEGVHFRLSTTPWADLGWKVMAINLSDIAAMGCVPRYAVVALGLSPDTDVESVAEMYRGMAEIAAEYDCSVVGGDTVSAPCTMVTVSLTGQACSNALYPENVLSRAAAREGDLIAVTGYLGGSGAGLRMLTDGLAFDDEAARYMERAHNHPLPRVAEGQVILQAGVRAAMDLSDGLLADLPKMCKESNVTARIDLGSVPIHPLVEQAFGEEALDLALTGGEDFELLFASDDQTLDLVARKCPSRVTVIGKMVSGDPGHIALVNESGREVQWAKSGWEHFTSSE